MNRTSKVIKLIYLLVIEVALLSLTACNSSSITCTVLDAETKKPIDGAVAIAFWNQTKGLGLTYTETVRIVEAVSDKDGKFTIPSVAVSIFADKPHLKIYKPGYIGWDSNDIYLGYESYNRMTPRVKKRTDYTWKDQIIILNNINNEFNYISHGSFLRQELPSSKDAAKSGIKYLFLKSIEEENTFRVEERNNLLKLKKEEKP